MAQKQFKKLNLDRKRLKGYIQEFCKQEFTSSNVGDINPVSEKSLQNRCNISADGKNIIIDFYYNNDGTTTIQPLVGTERDIQNTLASYILAKIDFKEVSNISYSIRLDKDTVNTVLEYLQELDGVQKTEEVLSPDHIYKLFKFIGPTGDKLVIKYFTNGTFQVQGKPLYLYHEVSCFLAQYLPFEKAVYNQEQAYCIQIDSSDMRQEIQDLLPKSHIVIDDTLQNILVMSLAFKKIDINLPDYSGFVTPAMRVLEGYIKRLLHDNGRIVNRTFDCFGINDATGLHVLHNNITKCANTKKAIEQAYNYYTKERHGLMHASGRPDMHVVIEDPKIAVQKIIEITGIIEHTYSYIAS